MTKKIKKSKKRLSITIGGAAASGKTTMAEFIKKSLEQEGYSLLNVKTINKGNGTLFEMQRGDFVVCINEGLVK